MIVTLTGAFKNAGDHLIGYRARELLRLNSDPDVVNINRLALTPAAYETMNQARAVLLTGGPAYQPGIYPQVYNLDLDQITTPVLPYGLGWKGKLGQEPEQFRFNADAGEFVKRVHADATRFSSARDHLTVRMLAAQGIQNVAMTGCPAWYDTEKLSTDYRFNPDVKRIVLSAPAVPQDGLIAIVNQLSKLYPKAEKFLAFNAGYKSTRSKNAAAITRWNYYMIAAARLRGFKAVSLESDFEGFRALLDGADLHVGYRVHSHIYSLSQRKTSMLIAEDSRGVGQLEAMGSPVVTADQTAAEQVAALVNLIDTRGQDVAAAVVKMRETYPEMVRFLKQF